MFALLVFYRNFLCVVRCFFLAGKLIASRRGSVYFVENSFARQTFESSKIDNIVCTGRTSVRKSERGEKEDRCERERSGVEKRCGRVLACFSHSGHLDTGRGHTHTRSSCP